MLISPMLLTPMLLTPMLLTWEAIAGRGWPASGLGLWAGGGR